MKTCPTCGQVFSLEDLLSNPLVVPLGMTSDEQDKPEMLYYFTHEIPECGTTFTVPAAGFSSVINQSIPENSMRGYSVCPGHCARINEFRLCQNECHWAPYRRLLLEMVRRRAVTRSTAK